MKRLIAVWILAAATWLPTGVAWAGGRYDYQLAAIDAQPQEAAQPFDAWRPAFDKPARIPEGGPMRFAALRAVAGGGGGGGSGTVSAGTVGQLAVYTDTTTIGGVDPLCTITGSNAAGTMLYGTGATTCAFFTWGSALQLNQAGAAPIDYTGSTITAGQLPTAISAAGVLTGTATPTLGASGTLGSVTMGNATSGTLTLRPVTGALGTPTVSLPAATDTLVGKATTDTLTNKTFDTAGTGNSFQINSVSTGATRQTFTQALNSPRIIYTQGLPMVKMSSGTATGSPTGTGAFTGLTAIPAASLPSKAYCWMPAGANVDGASTAGWYYCTFSGTTTGSVFNNRYTPSDTPPTIPGSPTAPTTLTTWTGDTGTVTVFSFTTPANALGANGQLVIAPTVSDATSNANTKTITLNFGSLARAFNHASVAQLVAAYRVGNLGATNVNVASVTLTSSSNITATGAVDTTADVTVSLTAALGTATDNIVMYGLTATIYSTGN